MRKYISITFFFVIFNSTYLFAGFVSEKEAQKVALAHYYQAYNSIKNNKLSWDSIVLYCLINPKQNQDYYYYVFSLNNNNSFIIVASHKSIEPILAYSFESGFNAENMSIGQQMFLNYYNESIKYAVKNKAVVSPDIQEKWNKLLNFDFKESFEKIKTVEPLLGTIQWNQTWPYNAMCPKHPNGFNGHVPVGCVATAMLQIMKYYNYPNTGEGAVFHSNLLNGGHGNVVINFAEQKYRWSNIPDKASSLYNEDLAKINFHASTSVRMYWTPNGSYSSLDRLVVALKEYFKYSANISLKNKSDYSENEWKNLLINQINNRKPVVYSGSASNSGHAWNCDGYQSDSFFHMNWGWGGAGNGYYNLNNLNSSATPGGEEYNFIENQKAVINIYPRDNYPNYCNQTIIINGIEGSFDDGSSNSDYLKNTDCKYIIMPNCGSIINLNFTKFDLANGDTIKIFDSYDISDKLIAIYYNDNKPNGKITTAYSGAMTIRFFTDDSTTSSGWKASYDVSYCKTNIIYNSPTGEFDDGSGDCEYRKSSVCTWIIEPENEDNFNYIIIQFKKFDLAHGADFVRIYKNSMTSSNIVETFTANNKPDNQIVLNAEKAIVQFFADANEVAKGWKLKYITSLSNIDKNNFEPILEVSIFPNPGNNYSDIFIKTEKYTSINIYVTDFLGRQLNKKQIFLNKGTNTIQIHDIVERKLNKGIYHISIEKNDLIYTNKFVVIE